jgi:ABC-type protease/lipase transport system fused ATPase/permease subunit
LLVLDEPNANLDAPGELALKDALLDCKQRGAAVMVITHRTTILDIVDVLMVLRNGALEMIGPTTEVYQRLQQSSAKQPSASGA